MNQYERKEVIERIYAALQERGYRPADQIIGYILTGDPTYITNYKGARHLITSIDRHDLLRDILKDYFRSEPRVSTSQEGRIRRDAG